MTVWGHGAARPSWVCPDDHERWPCDRARKLLSAAFHDDEETLAALMAGAMARAADDLGIPDPSRLYHRFVGWIPASIVDDPVDWTPCGRCGKRSHRVSPGSPPRLFPCQTPLDTSIGDREEDADGC